MSSYLLRLYVTGRSPQSMRAIRNLQAICDHDLAERYRIEIIDVVDDPDAAEAAEIVATPTVIKTLPQPLRRIIGDLSNTERVLVGLDLVRAEGEAKAPD